jgi:hypothetical protein
MAELAAYGKAVKGFALRPVVNSDGTATVYFDGNTTYHPQLKLNKAEAESLGLKPAAKPPPPPPPPPPPSGTRAGLVKARLDAKSAYDGYPLSWFTGLGIARLLVYPPAGDRYIKTAETLAYHDAWTTWGSSGATHIAEYVALVKRDREKGHTGQFMDDVNFAGGNIAGTKKQYADLVEAVRGELGSGVLEVNCQFPDIWPLIKAKDPDVMRALALVDVVTKEFNVSPTSGISSPSRFAEFVQYVDLLHGMDVSITMTGQEAHNTAADREYSLAVYLLNNAGDDHIGFSGLGPGKEYAGLTLDLGNATTQRSRASDGTWSRQFEKGLVIVNEPGNASHTSSLEHAMKNLAGATVTAVSLSGAQGAVLLV